MFGSRVLKGRYDILYFLFDSMFYEERGKEIYNNFYFPSNWGDLDGRGD
jgi:hypothetical protein